MRLFKTIKYIAAIGFLAAPLTAVAQEEGDTIVNPVANNAHRGFDAVKNFFRGGKRNATDEQVATGEKKTKKVDKSEQKSLARKEKKDNEDVKDYTVEELYDLSITDNLKTPKLGSQKAKIRSYQITEAKKLVACGQEAVETMRNGEVVIITIDTDNLFYPNETALKPAAGKYLTPFVKYLQEPDFYRMILAVHSDNTGSESYTDELTNKRALSVMEWFGAHAASGDYVIPYGMGAAEPLVLNNSMENRAKNRRMEIFLVPGKKMISDAAKGLLNH